MFEALADVAAAWRTLLHISEWSGLSLGALVGGAALIYLVPASRKLVILGAVGVLIGYVCVIHGDRVGRSDLQKQWDDSRTKAEAAQKARDADVARDLERKYQPELAGLQRLADERKARSDAYEKQILSLLAKAPAGAGASHTCELGAAADRMPKRK